MNARELYLKILNFDECERCLNWEFAYWGGALNRWYQEGLPKKYGLEKSIEYGETVCGPGLHYPIVSLGGGRNLLLDRDVAFHFNFDNGIYSLPINHWIYPKFDSVILEEDKVKQKIIDEDVITKIVRKDGSSMPHWIDWPVKDEKTWEKLKEERFQFNFEERIDSKFHDYDTVMKDKSCPVNLFGDPVGFYGSIRFLLGEINLLYMYKDNAKFIKKILTFLTDFWVKMAEEILSRYNIQVAAFWEDMSGKNGPLIGPNIFKEFMSPCYKSIIDFLKTKGVKHFIVDTDGNVMKLLPLFLELGITGMYPFERQAGNDLLEIRKLYPKLQMMGGFNKNLLAENKKEIDKELNIIRKMVKLGGYIPYCDHLVPPNVPWENYKYFRDKLTEIIYSTKIKPKKT